MRSVIQLADYGGAYSGNFLSSLKALDNSLRQLGLRQVYVFSDIVGEFDWYKQWCKENRTTYLVPAGQSVLQLASSITAIGRRENAVLLHTHFTTFDVQAWLASRLLRLPVRQSPKVVWHVHSAFPSEKNWKRQLKDLAKWVGMGRTTQAIAVSEDLQRQILSRRASPLTVRVVANGIDVQRATSRTQSREQIRASLGIPDDSMVLLAFGWDPVTKGIDLILTAMKILVQSNPNLLFAVVGQQRLREYLVQYFAGRSPEWLIVLPPQEQVGNLYRAADVFISASRWEGFSYSVGEAMAAGLPVLASDIPGLQWAREAPGVVMFPSEDSAALADGIRRIVNRSNTEQIGIGESNPEFIAARYSLVQWATGITRCYNDLL